MDLKKDITEFLAKSWAFFGVNPTHDLSHTRLGPKPNLVKFDFASWAGWFGGRAAVHDDTTKISQDIQDRAFEYISDAMSFNATTRLRCPAVSLLFSYPPGDLHERHVRKMEKYMYMLKSLAFPSRTVP